MSIYSLSLKRLVFVILTFTVLLTPTISLAQTDLNELMGPSSETNSRTDFRPMMGGETGDSQVNRLSPGDNSSSYVSDGSLQGYLLAFSYFLNGTLIPFIFALGLLFFLYNTVRYFIVKADDATARDQARKQALYGVLAFVFIVSVWGIVNMFIYGLELDDDVPVESDYVESNSRGSSPGSWLNSLMGGSRNNNTNFNSQMGRPADNVRQNSNFQNDDPYVNFPVGDEEMEIDPDTYQQYRENKQEQQISI